MDGLYSGFVDRDGLNATCYHGVDSIGSDTSLII
jgi:hypothetical protein